VTARRPPALTYRGLDELDGPHVMVDGASRPGTVLQLSHWPASTTPEALRRDLSAEIAFAYLEHEAAWGHGTATATIDHLDEDGLVSLAVLTDPAFADGHRQLLIEVARAGDFCVLEPGLPARVAFALARLIADGESPARGEGVLAARARRLLGVLPQLCEQPEDFSHLYAAEEAALSASLAALESGRASVEELAEVSLAVVRLPEPVPGAAGRAGDGAGTPLGLHRGAIHAVTSQPRVLVVEAGRTTYYDRYETWVWLVSRPLARRVDLQPLAAALDAADGLGSWRADPPGRTEPVMVGEGAGTLCEEEVLAALVEHLRSAPPAWEPTSPRPFSAAAASRAGTSGRGRARWRGRPSARP